MQMNLRRDAKILLNYRGGNKFDLMDRDGNVIMGANDNYYIYFKNVNFRANGDIDGRYLGVANDSMIDGYCRSADYIGTGYRMDDHMVKTARMVAVNNKTGVIIIIQND